MIAKFKKTKKDNSSKDLSFYIILTVFCVLMVGFLTYANLKLSARRKELNLRLQKLTAEVQELEQKKKELEEKILKSHSQEYLERIAREKLGFKKPGEEVVVIKKENEEEEEKERKKWWEWLKFWEK